MKQFTNLSYRGQVKRLKLLAQQALLNYNLGQVELVSLAHGENTTFKVDVEANLYSQNLKELNRYVLRIYRHNKHSIAAIHSELLWLTSLHKENDLVVPEPMPTLDGSFLAIEEAPGVPEPRCCALFRWLPGRFLKTRVNNRAMEKVGRFLAQLHQHSQQFIPPEGFERPRWDEDGLLGAFPISLPNESEGFVLPHDQATLESAARQIRERLQRLSQHSESFGLIHSDLHLGNCKFYNGACI